MAMYEKGILFPQYNNINEKLTGMQSCRDGDVYGLAKILSQICEGNILYYELPVKLFIIACDNNHYHIMRYLLQVYPQHILNHFASPRFSILATYCKKNKLNIVMRLIKITLDNKCPVDFKLCSIIISDMFLEPTSETIMEHLIRRYSETHQKIISYLECCGAKSYSKKIVL